MSDREIEIHDAREDTRDDHELEITRGNQSTAQGFTTPELCQLYAMIELRLRGLGFSRVRMLHVAQIASRPGPAQQARRQS